jgi:hypothetical protein
VIDLWSIDHAVCWIHRFLATPILVITIAGNNRYRRSRRSDTFLVRWRVHQRKIM